MVQDIGSHVVMQLIINGYEVAVIIKILAEYPSITINRLFISLQPTEIRDLGKEIKNSDHIFSNLLNYYIVATNVMWLEEE
ncbi:MULTISPECIES: hypothetical protein [Bacillus cereus group]|uniref:Uncharacterized protein n=2 Tax=Bacillus cereus group TaxID=86661 RepID=A0A242WA38_BACTU|nr:MULTISPECIES: hypothetical protein [Bacillus cereus group]OTW46231.1 hypothetical protein BK699_21570 [Bacillus thuringiensis serovar mexicanensis]MEB9672408.1 hypothetical protein [Bacillus anthracis]OTW50456.1 hypothetical protein BK699_10595 [Bacillus thuringiensis serovar mexicanensis]OTW54934.1 hypothetical protein BK699_02280 [Bacillus thuringiensis serovar mexicanensis]OTX06225.1 hypothetical protein BK705_11245 [Bacillus thuringiensis serovar monterrey]